MLPILRHTADMRHSAATWHINSATIWHSAIDNIRHLANALGSTTEVLGTAKPFSTAVGVARSTNGSLACLGMAAMKPHGISIYMQKHGYSKTRHWPIGVAMIRPNVWRIGVVMECPTSVYCLLLGMLPTLWHSANILRHTADMRHRAAT